jgi:hypothetical protein
MTNIHKLLLSNAKDRLNLAINNLRQYSSYPETKEDSEINNFAVSQAQDAIISAYTDIKIILEDIKAIESK